MKQWDSKTRREGEGKEERRREKRLRRTKCSDRGIHRRIDRHKLSDIKEKIYIASKNSF